MIIEEQIIVNPRTYEKETRIKLLPDLPPRLVAVKDEDWLIAAAHARATNAYKAVSEYRKKLTPYVSHTAAARALEGDNGLKETIVGALGEVMNATVMELRGNKVVMSNDFLDAQKDMTVNGRPFESKTQVPLIKHKSFTVRMNQEKKIREAAYVIFNAIEPKNYKSMLADGNSLWGVDVSQMFNVMYVIKGSDIPKNLRTMTFEGRDMLLIPIEFMRPWCGYGDCKKIVAEFQKYTKSYM